MIRRSLLLSLASCVAMACIGDGVTRPRPPALARPYPGELIAHSFGEIRGHAVDAQALYLLATGDPYGERPLLIAAARARVPLDGRIYYWSPIEGERPGGPASDGSTGIWLGAGVTLAGIVDGHALAIDGTRLLEVAPTGAIVRVIESPDAIEAVATIAATPRTPSTVLWKGGGTLRWQRGDQRGEQRFPDDVVAIAPDGRFVYVAAGLQLWRLDGERLDAAPELRLDRPQLAPLIGRGGFGELVAAGGALWWQVGGAVLRIDDHGPTATVAAAAAAAWQVWAFAVVGSSLFLQTERSGTEWWWLPLAGGEASRVESLPADGARFAGMHDGSLWFVMTRVETPHLGPLPGDPVRLHDLVAIPPERLR